MIWEFLIVDFCAYMAEALSVALLFLMIQLSIVTLEETFTPPPYEATPFWMVNPSTTTAKESGNP